jgi:hypothetical protein
MRSGANAIGSRGTRSGRASFPPVLKASQTMYLTALFLLLTATLATAAYGSKRAAVGLAVVSFVFAVGVYFHHASDALPLSF